MVGALDAGQLSPRFETCDRIGKRDEWPHAFLIQDRER
jgi:hypothetical protein